MTASISQLRKLSQTHNLQEYPLHRTGYARRGFLKVIKMCLKATCSSCQKATWWGCGKHISDILDDITQDDWCTCEPKVKLNAKEYPPMAPKADGLPGWVCKAASIFH